MQPENFNAGKLIKLLRRIKGYSQLQVAKGLCITQQAYSKIEKQKWIEGRKLDSILAALKSCRRELDMIRKISGEINYTCIVFIMNLFGCV